VQQKACYTRVAPWRWRRCDPSPTATDLLQGTPRIALAAVAQTPAAPPLNRPRCRGLSASACTPSLTQWTCHDTQ
jgi:hypothetical protein